MQKKNIVLLIILSLVIVFWLIFFQKQLEIFLFDSYFDKPSEILVAQVSQNYENSSRSINRTRTVLDILKTPEFQAKSVLSLKIDSTGKEEIIFQRNIKDILPIASLTKLMTAVIVFENYGSTGSPQDPIDEKIIISKEAVVQESDRGNLKVEESVSIKNLLTSMLIESSNDAAYALAENMDSINSPQVDSTSSLQVGIDQFLEKMNLKAKELGMLNSNFSNPTGLDGTTNYSTSEDLVKLVKYILLNYPQIWEITSKVSAEILNDDGTLHHFAINTNELLSKIPNVIGGKTGYNEEALGCLILLLKNTNGDYLINIILGSPDRFTEMETLINWVKW